MASYSDSFLWTTLLLLIISFLLYSHCQNEKFLNYKGNNGISCKLSHIKEGRQDKTKYSMALMRLGLRIPARLGSNLPVAQLGIRAAKHRFYATAPRNDGGELPSIKKLLMIGLAGTAVFVLAVNSLDKQQPKNSYSESEFESLQRLKRKVALFPGNKLKVYGVLGTEKYNKIVSGGKIVDPRQIIEKHRTTAGDRYEALLNILYDKYGAVEYFDMLPQGLMVKLVSLYMKDNCSEGDTVVILDFPKSIKDASQFETEVAGISKFIVSQKLKDTDICKYYDAVGKLESV